ncbi:MAG: outer membrane beta-barrel protein [Melioribacteraceae bacterium]|nr:outer membrane beta-barrel protein [Melioribacteraceae bacterium]
MKQKLILTLMVISFLTISLVGQSIKIGVGGGYTALGGDNSFTAEDVLNLNSGMHYGGKLIVGLPLLPIQFTANVFQNSLSSDVTLVGEKFTTETSFLSIGLGAEFTLIPGPVQPYLAAELLFTSFGDATINDITFSESESKTGVGFGAGLYFKLLPIIDLDLSAHYNMNTLLSDGDALNSTHIRLNVLFSIL